jgi:hypothetical protein
VMVHSDPDVMLIDEVLAVGDAAFQQKCLDVFHRLKMDGKTIVLVTHAMGLVEQFCDRAMLLSQGDIKLVGEPHEVGRAYLTENFAGSHGANEMQDATLGAQVRVVDAWITNAAGEQTDALLYAEQFMFNLAIEALADLVEPSIAVWLTNEDGIRVFTVGARENGDRLGDLHAGERVQFSFSAHNPMSAGRYHFGCSVVRGSAGLDIVLHRDRLIDMVSYGMDFVGLIELQRTGMSLTRSSAPAAIAQ